MTSATAHIAREQSRLSAYALFAALLAAAGLPIYIHAPKFYVDEYGVSLAALGAVLFALRLLDVVQDPVLGWLSERLRHVRAQSTGAAVAVMALAMFGLFAVAPPLSPVIWFAPMLTLVFSAFSFLTINFYAQGVLKAERLRTAGHLRLARWRESGALIGVCLAAIAPVALGQWLDAPFTGFAVGFALVALLAGVAMRPEWSGQSVADGIGFREVLRDPMARRLLLIALVNAAPVAVSSTLFLFFVETTLAAPGKEGVLLLVFFLSAALSAPVWSLLAERFGVKPVLLGTMVGAVLAFGLTLQLGAGEWISFALICCVTGATLGADLTLLPALFSRRLARISPSAAQGFGLWSFVSKLSLAFAAAVLLPSLEAAGFESGAAEMPDGAETLLPLLYAGVPCALKLLAIVLVAATDLDREDV